VIDDLQYLLNPDGEIADAELRAFVAKLLRAADKKKNKIFLVTTHVPMMEDDGLWALIERRHIGGLDPKHSESLFSFWFRFEREDLSGHGLSYPDRLLELLHGHPLAVKTAAKLRAEQAISDAKSDLALFKRLRETMVQYVLDHVVLAPHEEEFLRFASVFRVPVSRAAFVGWKGDEAIFMLESLLGRSLMESDGGETYQLHPIIRDHFYMSCSIDVLRPFHKVAGNQFLHQYRIARAAGLRIDPEVVGEAVHHLLCANERDKVREFGLYKTELKPVALMHYRKKEFDLALKDYRVLVDLDPSDPDAHFHLAVLYGHEQRWNEAEQHFGKAMSLKGNGYWILQGYASVLMRHNRLEEAEHYLRQAERINGNHSPTLVDLGRLCAKTNRPEDAEKFFERAIEADPENTRAYFEFARLCKDEDRFERGLELALAAVATNPRDQRNKELVKELRQKITGQARAV
jgi:tetratricopeptide (TPR) repeat protein